ncbi:MAG: hypothetical protein A4E57_00168 [Syntrophorhabdaceae bacterium PtaU1.Bin034]|nr:MAG: hypothetical protein A4E57_00168 [Syntrophorhabdaceae bacterium PtaU1.Bin034]
MLRAKGLLSAAVIASLMFVGPIPHCLSQEGPDTVKGSQGQETTRPQRLKARPERYPKALAGLEVIADLTATPAVYNGKCPPTITFKGKIGVNIATIIHYRFVRSDNVRSQPGVLVFEEPGTKEVTATWQLDDVTPSTEFTGWQAIQISYPAKVQSNTAYFRGTCEDDGKSVGEKN